MRARVFLILGFVAASCAPALAQSCYARDVLADGLSERFGEEPQLQAMTASGDLFEVFVSPSGSWTATISTPDGRSCPIAAGHGVDLIAPVDGDPA